VKYSQLSVLFGETVKVFSKDITGQVLWTLVRKIQFWNARPDGTWSNHSHL